MYKEASATPHDYYHLLSGVDLPLKPIDEIHNFFEQHAGQLFIRFTNDTEMHRKRIKYCVDYYHPTMHFSRTLLGKGLNLLRVDNILVILQKTLGISRMRKDGDMKMYKGHNWMSLPEDAIKYLITQENYIRHRFRLTCCADEIFAHTVFMASPFKSRIFQGDATHDASIREIDWLRGGPYIWTMAELQELKDSQNLFARKFSTEKDLRIIEEIEKML